MSPSLAQRLHVAVWYTRGPPKGYDIITFRSMYLPYSYMEPLGSETYFSDNGAGVSAGSWNFSMKVQEHKHDVHILDSARKQSQPHDQRSMLKFVFLSAQ